MTDTVTLVTGAEGYIGRALFGQLRARGEPVIGLDRVQSKDSSIVQADLTHAESYEAALNGVSTIYHLAAAKGDWGISHDEYFRDNVEATRSLVSAASNAGVKRWVFYSTVSVLGPSSLGLTEDAVGEPNNSYGSTKLDCEKIFEELVANDPAVEVVIIRPSAVFGPEHPWSTNIYRLVEAIRKNRFVMVGDGATIKTTSYIENLLSATAFLAECLKPGMQVYHYVDSPALSMNELVTAIYELLEKPKPRLRIPLGIARSLGSVGDAASKLTGVDLPITSARIKKFCTSTDFSAQKIRDLGFVAPVSSEAALRETVRWHLDSIP